MKYFWLLLILCFKLEAMSTPSNEYRQYNIIDDVAYDFYKSTDHAIIRRYVGDKTSLTSLTLPSHVVLKLVNWNADKNKYDTIRHSCNVVRIGHEAFSGCVNLKSLTIGDEVTHIEYKAFSGCNSLNGLTIPDATIEIGSEAFRYCYNLENLRIGDNVTIINGGAFQDCNKLKSLILGNSIKQIGDWTFAGCSELKSISIPDEVQTIGVAAFQYCDSLTDLHLGKGLLSIGNRAFDRCRKLQELVVPGNVQSIDWSAFSGCYSLRSLTLNEGLVVIASYSFSGNIIETLEIPNSVQTIGTDAFKNNGTLKELSLGHSLKYIGERAFNSCSSLQTLHLSCQNLENIGKEAFYNCCLLEELELPSKNTQISEYAFWNSVKLKHLKIDGGQIGNYAFENCRALESLVLGDDVTSIGVCTFSKCDSLLTVQLGTRLKTIGNYAFNQCYNLKSVSIPDSVTTIGAYAFYECRLLEELHLGKSLAFIGYRAFYNCPLLESVIVPDSTGTIGEEAFYGCNNLSELRLGKNLKEIGGGAFAMCNNLLGLIIPENVTHIYDRAFTNCLKLDSLIIPNGVEYIGRQAFSGCKSLKELSIPESITEINASAFAWCNSLQSLKIPNSVFTIGEYAFRDCSNMDSLIIGNSVKEIHAKAFASCVKLRNLTLPHSLTVLGDEAFGNCESLENLMMGKHIKEIPSYAFCNCRKLTHLTLSDDLQTIGISAFGNCSSLESIEFGDKVIEINDRAFQNCPNLTSLNLPSSTTKIGSNAFSGCGSLATLSIPDNVTTVGSYAFSGCGKLMELMIGNHVEGINEGAFSGCDSLKSLIIPNTVKTIGNSAFQGCDSLLSLTLGSGLTQIGNNAFYNCKSLENIYCKSTQPVNILQSVFSYDEQYYYLNRWRTRTVFNSHPILFVPENSENLYKEHNVWKLFLMKKQMKMVAFNETSENGSNNSSSFSSPSNSGGYVSSQDEIEVEGVTADGTSKVLVYFDRDIENLKETEWTFKINGEEIDRDDPRVGTCGQFQMFGAGKWGFVYTAPENYLSEGNEYSLSIEVNSLDENNASITGYAPPIRILRPGVILIHGFFSSHNCFDVLEKKLIRDGGYYSYQINNVDYHESTNASFTTNTDSEKIVDKACKLLQARLLQIGRIVSSKYDFVGHSMGGILVRKYAQEVSAQPINRIITLDTPHYGSEISSKRGELIRKVLMEEGGFIIGSMANLTIGANLKNLADILGATSKYGAINDLGVNSEAIVKLNNNDSMRNAIGIPVHAICSYMTKETRLDAYCEAPHVYHGDGYRVPRNVVVYEKVPLKDAPIELCADRIFAEEVVVNNSEFDILNSLFGGFNDGIVSVRSQLGGLDVKSEYVSPMVDVFRGFYGVESNAHHCSTHHWTETLDKIQELLHLPKNSERYNKNGFNPLPASSRTFNRGTKNSLTFAEAEETSFIKLDVLKDEDERLAIIHVDQSPDIVSNLVFARVGNDDILISNDSTDFCFAIPETFNGELEICALGRTNYNALVADVASSEFTNTAKLNRLFFEGNTPLTVNVGEKIDAKVVGWWSNGEDTYLTPEYSTSTEGILEIEGSTIKAVACGECMLTASYLGLSDSIQVCIIPMTYLKGDVDGDGEITAQDASLVLQLVAGKISAETEGVVYEAANVDGDDEVTAQDASLILQHVAGKITIEN